MILLSKIYHHINNLPSYQTLTNAFRMFEKETLLPSTVELISKAV